MNENQTLLEIYSAIAAMLDSNCSYFSAPSYMEGFFAYGIILCLLYDDFLWPHIHLLVCNAYIYAFVRKWSCKPHKAGKNASIRGKKTHVYRVAGMIASIRWKTPHVDRVIILKQMADHRRRSLFCRSVGCK